MRKPSALFDRTMSKIKRNRAVTALIGAGTVVIALAAFSNAAGSLLKLVKGRTPATARRELAELPVQYTPQAFVDSAKQGDERAVNLFLEAGMDPNAKDDNGSTALINAVAKNDTKMIKALLKARATVSEKNDEGATALSRAAARGNLETVRLLLAQGADPNAIDEAFLAAAEDAHSEVMPALLEKGANLKAIGSGALLAAAGSPEVGISDKGRSDTIRFLLDMGVDVNARDDEGWTALLLAARLDDRPSAVRTLLDRGADVNAKCRCPGYASGGWTALMIAAGEGRGEIVRMLLAKHADVTLKNNMGQTALALAERRGQADVVRILSTSQQPPLRWDWRIIPESSAMTRG